MTWFGVLYIVLMAIGVIYTIARIGHPREPFSPTDAICALVIAAFYIWGVFYVGVWA